MRMPHRVSVAAGMAVVLTLLCSGLFATPVRAAGAGDQAPLARFAADIGAMVRLTLAGDRLALDRKWWSREVEGKAPSELIKERIAELIRNGYPEEAAEKEALEQLARPAVLNHFERLQEKCKLMSGGGHESSESRECTFSSTELNGLLQLQRSRVRLEFTEVSGPRRTLLVTEEQGALHLQLQADGEWSVNIVQSPSGSFAISDLRRNPPLAVRAKSFAAFYKSHRDYVEHDLLPLYETIGITAAFSPNNSELQQVLFQILQPLPQTEREQAEALLAALDSDEFATREAAAVQLERDFVRFRTPIAEALADAHLSVETRGQLKRVQARYETWLEREQMIQVLEFTDDLDLLIELLPQATGSRRAGVIQALERISGQRLGNEPAVWQAWWQSRRSRMNPHAKTPLPSVGEGGRAHEAG